MLRSPGILRALVPYVLARIASAMVLLSLMLHVQRSQGSFVAAGLLTAVFATAVAIASPLLGRLVDSRGQTGVLVSCGLIHPLALSAVVLAATGSQPLLALPAAALAGASLPPMASCMRALWPELLDDEQLRPTAFAVESLVVELCELGGPLLVGALIALIAPGAAVIVAAALSGAGTLVFAVSGSSGARRKDRRAARAPRSSPLRSPGVRRLVLGIGIGVASVAALEVSIASYAHSRGSTAVAGWLIAAWVSGSLLSGWYYGSRSWRTPLPLQLVGLLLAGALLGLGPLLAAGPTSMAVLLACAGLALAPATAVQFALLSELAPDRRRTESFTWASTAAFLGVAMGNLAAGPVVEFGSWRVGVVLAAALGGLGALVAWSGRYRFGLERPDAGAVPVELYDEILAELDAALTAARAVGRRNDELARQLADLRSHGRDGAAGRVRSAELLAEQARHRVDRLVQDGIGVIDGSLDDLRTLERRRAAVLADLEELRATLLAAEQPDAVVTSLPLQGIS